MKIAYILYPEVVVSNRSNGVRSQAVSWANILKSLGHDVELVNNWGDYDWKTFDVIHLFGSGGSWVKNVLKRLSVINSNVVISPIIDPLQTESFFLQKIRANTGRYTKNLVNTNDSLVRCGLNYGKIVLARSAYEKEHLIKVYGINQKKIEIIPLSYSKGYSEYVAENYIKEKFCFHVSSIYQERKNVIRLIRAARRYNFHLVLAGNKGSETDFALLKKEIDLSNNVEVLGFVSEKEKIELYKKAKVFALPSTQEGVGIVALDAALFGCEIAMTNIPGPKEYYGNQCLLFNPYNVDEIGKSIRLLLDGEVSFQPELKKYIDKKFSESRIGQDLISAYKKAIGND